MNSDDYAVVVGISKYPSLGIAPNSEVDLQAPDVDAAAVAAWLRNPDGGDLPKDNVIEFRTSQFQTVSNADTDEPQPDQIRKAFRALRKRAEDNQSQGKGLQVGRRLYIYMSGHGFSPKQNQGALFGANATSFDPLNSFASGWLEWFQDSGYFKEFVLWLDCCMDREFTVTPEALFRPSGSSQPAGPTVIAFAAARPLKAVERPIAADGGNVHGIFTWTLLAGLRGAAAEPGTGKITGRNLGDYVKNSMKQYLSADDLQDPDISKVPRVIRDDPDLVFRETSGPVSSSTILTFPPDCNGKDVSVWSGHPPEPSRGKIKRGTVVKQLNIGLHVVEVPGAGIRQGFEVTTGEETKIAVSDKGPEVNASTRGVFQLSVQPENPTAEIFVIDHALATINHTIGFLGAGLEFGLYKVRLRLGRDIRDSILLLDRNVTLKEPKQATIAPKLLDSNAKVTLEQPQISSAAPVDGTTFTHEYHVGVASSWETQPFATPRRRTGVAHGGASELRIMARLWTSTNRPRTGSSRTTQPWAGIELVRADGQPLLNLRDLPIERPEADPYVRARIPVRPGAYVLRRRLTDQRIFEQSLIVPADWALEVYLLAVPPRDTSLESEQNARKEVLPDRCTVLLKRIERRPETVGQRREESRKDQILESARIALADERAILNDELESLLFYKFRNPIAGIIGAHLLIMQADRDPRSSAQDLDILDTVVPNLRELVGKDHPDVEAISLRCPAQKMRRSKPFAALPMFERSWRLMIEASGKQPNIFPQSLWEDAHASVQVGGYLAWSADLRSKQAHVQQLRHWLEVMVRSEERQRIGGVSQFRPKLIAELSAQIGIPKSIATKLLQDDSEHREAEAALER